MALEKQLLISFMAVSFLLHSLSHGITLSNRQETGENFVEEELTYELASILCEASPELKNAHSPMESMGRGGFMYEELPSELHPARNGFTGIRDF